MSKNVLNRAFLPITIMGLSAFASGLMTATVSASELMTVAETPTTARSPEGEFISWREHRIDDEDINGGVPIRGGDGIATGDIDGDGLEDLVTAHEDSNHIRVAFSNGRTDEWTLRTIAEGQSAGAVEDIALIDLNADGYLDVVAACEDAHLLYLQNPGEQARAGKWSALIPEFSKGRGSWLRVFATDIDGDGRAELTAANKGTADVVRLDAGDADNGATSLIRVVGNPLDSANWRETVLYEQGVPNTALPVDIDGDGDMDVIAAKRVRQQIVIIENQGVGAHDELRTQAIPVQILPGFDAPAGWRGLSNAFHADTADINNDGRLDLLVNVLELADDPSFRHAGLGWLQQGESLDDPWVFRRIGNTLPDWVIGIHVTDIDGDEDHDVVTGGYSGINIIEGAYSGASRDFDDPSVTTASSVGRIAWFENPGRVGATWKRHDVSRRVRGMFDMYVSRDLDGDGDMDLISTRGNSGDYDGVFWLEQIRSKKAAPSFIPARKSESRHLPLPPENWLEIYDRRTTYIAPNKMGDKP
jgi:hypothetical protein